MDDDALFGVFQDKSTSTKRKFGFQKPSDSNQPSSGAAVAVANSTPPRAEPTPAASLVATAGSDGVDGFVIETHPVAPPGKKARLADADAHSTATLNAAVASTISPSSATTSPAIVADVNASNSSVAVKPAAADDEEDEAIECLHEVSLPPSHAGESLAPYLELKDPKLPARTFPFTLDPFQRVSIACLEREESVLVSAHTSAGKTVVAEYAIAMALKQCQRVIYTSPIKALSNQKYRELFEVFSDVGLMTGDVTINVAASCLVMTTEILRSMLYRGSEILREVKWVIYDEVHYMRDKERGVVWEETLILLPDNVRFVFLSATIPNAKEFADWVARIHSQPCHVVFTDRRPVPLQHYVFPAGGDGLHLVVDEKCVFREENFTRALAQLASSPMEARDRRRKQQQQQQQQKKGEKPQSDAYKIVKMIMERRYEPVIVFAFSKKECEQLALQMARLDFNTDDEKQLVTSVFRNAVDCLSADDKQLPQIAHCLPLLQRGIGIHHSGLLPILKEVIEILFQEGLLKALFATETFSIGLNMPARTVVFTSVRKFDGSAFRWISGGEYIQMSGRAGRRGKDDRGIVILCVDEKMEPAVARGMLKGHADPLNSSFYLSYNMLLNLIRVEGCDPEALIARSFHQFQHDRQLPELQRRLQLAQTRLDSLSASASASAVGVELAPLEEYHLVRSQQDQLSALLREAVMTPLHAVPFLSAGRLVRVRGRWGAVVNVQRKSSSSSSAAGSSGPYLIDCLLPASVLPQDTVTSNSNAHTNDSVAAISISTSPTEQSHQLEVIPVTLSVLEQLSTIRLYLPKDLRTRDARLSVEKSLRQVHKQFPDGVPLLDPLEDMRIEDDAVRKLIRRLELLQEQLRQSPLHRHPQLEAAYAALLERKRLESECKELRRQLKSVDGVVMRDELKAMKRVLRRLGYVSATDEGVIELKGRVACEINAGDELLLSELLFHGHFNELSPEQCAALLSCVVFQEKSTEVPRLPETLSAPLLVLQDTARRIARVAQESKLSLNTEEYVQSFRPHLMEVVYAWARGAKFIDVCKMTDTFEGSIIRAMRRLEELLKQMCAAAKAIGNSELESKFSEAINKIKRDIVFASSLYL